MYNIGTHAGQKGKCTTKTWSIWGRTHIKITAWGEINYQKCRVGNWNTVTSTQTKDHPKNWAWHFERVRFWKAHSKVGLSIRNSVKKMHLFWYLAVGTWAFCIRDLHDALWVTTINDLVVSAFLFWHWRIWALRALNLAGQFGMVLYYDPNISGKTSL